MLVGQKNEINDKLVEEISQVYKIKFRDFQNVLKDADNGYSPRVILVNLMDIGPVEEELIAVLKKHYPRKKMIAIHCFQTDSMIQKTLEKGYDSYLSIFNISEEFMQKIDH